MSEEEPCPYCPVGGATWYEGKEETCRVCGRKWRGNGLEADQLIEMVEGPDDS